jgi:hypothetical protein
VRVQREGFDRDATTWGTESSAAADLPAVLAIGLDPRFADYSAMPGLTPELVRAYIDVEMERVRDVGYELETCLLAPDGTAEAEIEAALRRRTVACVVIGAGLREPAEHLLLFEKILNLVRRLAPDACVAFNSTPADTAEAVRRCLNG